MAFCICKSTMVMMILKKVVANAAEMISMSRWYSTEGEQRPTLFEELDGECQAGRAGFSRLKPSSQIKFFIFDFCCLGFVYCFGALVLHAWGTVLYNVCECEECRWNSSVDLGSLVLAWSSDWCEFNSLGVELYTASHHNTIYIRLHGEDGEDDCIYQIRTLYTLAQKIRWIGSIKISDVSSEKVIQQW